MSFGKDGSVFVSFVVGVQIDVVYLVSGLLLLSAITITYIYLFAVHIGSRISNLYVWGVRIAVLFV